MGRLTDLLAAAEASPRARAVPFLAVPAAMLGASFVLGDRGLGVPVCLLHTLTGVPCPSCGMTRAFGALSHGRLADAIRFNLASPLVYAAAIGIAALAFAQVVTGRDVLAPVWGRTRRAAFIATIAALSVAWIAALTRM